MPSAVLWEILCDSGLRTDYADFHAFHDALTATAGEVRSLDDFLTHYFGVTEEIQSSPAAASVSAYQVVAKAHRRSRVTRLELRFNPLKRVRHGLHTLDAIILAVMQGLERASLHYGVETGIILSLGRDLSLEENAQIVEAAIQWRGRGALKGASGVVGLDMAGPESGRHEFDADWLRETAVMLERGRSAGLKLTYHIGETAASGPDGMARVLEAIRPQRLGHGIELRHAGGAQRERLLAQLRELDCCLELCPSVNLVTRSIGDLGELAVLARALTSADLPWGIATDNPYLIHTNLRREHDLLGQALGADAAALLARARQAAQAHSFLASPPAARML